MAEPFVGQLLTLPFNWAPNGWATCNGQLLPLQQNETLFALIGQTYGGDGRATVGVPNLCGRTVVGSGNAFGKDWTVGATGGAPAVALTPANLPAHTHSATFTPTGGPSTVNVSATVTGSLNTPVTLSASYNAVNANANSNTPAANSSLGIAQPPSVKLYTSSSGTAVPIGTVTAQANVAGSLNIATSGSYPVSGGGAVSLGATGQGAALNIMPAYVGMNVVIATLGIYPMRG